MTLKKLAFSGVKWTSISSLSMVLTQIIKISILTRFLQKSDFGLMALVVFVLGFMSLFMDSGLTSAILHKQQITKKEYSSIYWLNLCTSIVLYLVICLIAPLISRFYLEKEIVVLLRLMGLSLIISAIGILFKTIEQKELNFKFITIIDIFSSITSLIVAIILAIKGFGIYSLVYSSLIQYAISNTIFLIKGLSKNVLSFHYNFNDSKSFLKIGVYQVAGQIINYFNRDLDILIIGKFFGSEILGGYSLAKQLVFRPAQMIYPIFTGVATPVLAKFQNNIKLLGENYLKLSNIISTINIPMYLLIIIFAHPIVYVLYGDSFYNIIPLVRILSVYMIIRASGNPIGCLTIATGRTDLEFYWNIVTLAIIPLAIVIGAQYSIEWVALSILITMILLLVPFWYFLIWKMIKVSFSKYIKSLIPSFQIIKYISSSIS